MGSLAKQMSGQGQQKVYAKGGKVASMKATASSVKGTPKVATGSPAEIPAFMKKGGKCK